VRNAGRILRKIGEEKVKNIGGVLVVIIVAAVIGAIAIAEGGLPW
jgi:hypothetical protein